VGYLTRFGDATYHTSERDTIWGKRGRTRPRQRWPRIGPWRALSLRLSVSPSLRRPVTCTSHFARAQADNTRDTTTSSSIQGKHGDSRQILHGASDPTSQRPRSAAAAAAVDRPARSVVQVAEFPSSHALVVDRVVGVSRHGACGTEPTRAMTRTCAARAQSALSLALSRSLLSHALARCLFPHVARMHRFRDW